MGLDQAKHVMNHSLGLTLAQTVHSHAHNLHSTSSLNFQQDHLVVSSSSSHLNFYHRKQVAQRGSYNIFDTKMSI